MKMIHRITGLWVAVFVIAHLFNHCSALFGVETHTHVLYVLRKIYRIPIVEFILMLSFAIQVFSGIYLFIQLWKQKQKNTFEYIKMYSGILLGFFLLQHIGAVWIQRYTAEADTNFYFAAYVVNQNPLYFYFIPYYFLGIMSFGLHVASIHRSKIIHRTSHKLANLQFIILVTAFLAIAIVILLAFTGVLYDIEIPDEYHFY